jgi:hypothetical protein
VSAVLERLARAEVVLAEVVSIDEAKALRDMAEAARVLARQVRAGTARINYATSVKVRAELRLAALVDEGQQAGTIARRGRRARTDANDSLPNVRAANLYRDLGLTAREVFEARLLASHFTDDDVVRLIGEATAARRELSRRELLQAAREARNDRYCVVGYARQTGEPWPGALVYTSSTVTRTAAAAQVARWQAEHPGCFARFLRDGRPEDAP